MEVLNKLYIVLFSIYCCSSFYAVSAEDIEKIQFVILTNYNDDKQLECSRVTVHSKVGEKLRIQVKSYEAEIHETASCYKSLTSEEFTYPLFSSKKYDNQAYTSKMIINVTEPGKWEYKCVFHDAQCTIIRGRKCIDFEGSGIEHNGTECNAAILVEDGVKPSGYLMVNGRKFASNTEENLYKYHDRENINLTCHKTVGRFVEMLHTTKAHKQVVYAPRSEKKSLNMHLDLVSADNGSVMTCTITEDNVTEDITVTFVFDEDDGQTDNTVWIIVLGLVLVALLTAIGIWLVYRHKKRRHTSNTSRVVFHSTPAERLRRRLTASTDREHSYDYTYADPDAFGNIYMTEPTSQKNSSKEHTYLNTNQPNEPYARVNRSAPSFAPIYREPNHAPTYREPNHASIYRGPNQAPMCSEPSHAPVYRDLNHAPFNREPNYAPLYREPSHAPTYHESSNAPMYCAPNKMRISEPDHSSMYVNESNHVPTHYYGPNDSPVYRVAPNYASVHK